MYLSRLFAFSALLFRLLFLVQRSLCVSCGKRCQTSRPDSSGSNRECCCHACGHAGPAAFPPRRTASGIASHAGSPSLSKAPPSSGKSPAERRLRRHRLCRRGVSTQQTKKPGREGTGSFSQARCLQVMHRRVPLQVSDAPPFSLQRNPVSLCNGVIRLYGGRLLLQEKRMTTTSRPSSSPQALRFPILRPAFSCMAGSIRAHASWTAPAPLVPSVFRRKRIRADTSSSSQILCLRRSEKPLTYFFRRTDGSYPYSCTHPYPRHKRNRRYW